MAKNSTLQQKAAREFAERWADKGYEKGHTQSFWLELLQKVFGVEDPYSFISFEDEVMVDNTNFMDGYIASTKVLIEQKSIKKDLGAPIVQSNGEKITPFLQARKYIAGLPLSKHPRWVVTCNFREFWVYDTERPNDPPQIILLKDFEKDYERLLFLVESGNEHLKREMEVSVKAGNLVGLIYDKLLEQYIDKDSVATLKSLNILCVRLVFCLYAEDAHLFGHRAAFHDYLAQYEAKDIRRALIDLFQVLDTPRDRRDPYMDETLKAFPYVNGGLFSHEVTACGGAPIVPQFTDELRTLILDKASADFDWSEISPTIFGAVFESTLNPETRRSGGMHYTSIENIHKVIDPLFLDGLKAEFETIKESLPKPKQNFNKTKVVYDLPISAKQRLLAFQEKIASLTFLDPACGSGNFLTESYISLRRLENEIISVLYLGQSVMGEFTNPIKVNIHQFYGIEINDFAVSVATTALWIAEEQMLQETEKIAAFAIEPLPLKSYNNIHEGNALRLDWSGVIAPQNLNYIMGNPPFVGYNYQTIEQKEDLQSLSGVESANLDYVAGWYYKTAEYIQNTNIRAAFVSTNSITQGEQVASIWDVLFRKFKVKIDFAYRTFRWDNEADIKAHVHCVIIGFSADETIIQPKRIYLDKGQFVVASNINGYLLDAPNVAIYKRTKPLCDVPPILRGSIPQDDNNFILSEEERAEIIRAYPQTEKYIKQYLMGEDFLNGGQRYCLWLLGANLAELRNVAPVVERIKRVQEFRAASKRDATRKNAATPTLFGEIRCSKNNYIAMPVVSSETRRYIPMAYLSPVEMIAGSSIKMIENASLYHFGVLMSNVHNAWTRVVTGRLEMRINYANTLVYNNFPWPTPTAEQKAKIEQTAQAILNARALYPDSSLADLYDEIMMPPELRRAHQENDRAVMQAYGMTPGKTSESECVAELFKMYQGLTK